VRKLIAIAASLAAAVALAGCGARERIVKVPVAVACAPDALPAEPPKVGPLSGNAEADIGPVAAALLRWKAYAGELRAILHGCSGGDGPAPPP
jgi:hypothetical protein